MATSDKMKRWQKNAKDTYKDLKDIDPDKATKQQFILYAACIALKGHDDYQGETTHPIPEHTAQGESKADTDYITVEDGKTPCTPLDYAEKELSGAEEYYAMWIESKEMDYKKMAQDKLRHSEFWLMKAKGQGQDISSAMTWHNSLMAKLQ